MQIKTINPEIKTSMRTIQCAKTKEMIGTVENFGSWFYYWKKKKHITKWFFNAFLSSTSHFFFLFCCLGKWTQIPLVVCPAFLELTYWSDDEWQKWHLYRSKIRIFHPPWKQNCMLVLGESKTRLCNLNWLSAPWIFINYPFFFFREGWRSCGCDVTALMWPTTHQEILNPG